VLRTDKRDYKTISTLHGKVTFSRYILRPDGKASKSKLLATEGIKSVAPLDCYLGIAGLPFKMTVEMMLRLAYWAQNQCSYQAAEKTVSDIDGVYVNDDTIRLVTNHVGGVVFAEDWRRAEETYSLLDAGKLPYNRSKKGVLYIQTDGAALNTRHMDSDGSTWRENKLGVVFSSDNIRQWTDRHGERQHKIQKREYTSYIGGVSEFKKLLLACAVRNGYGSYKETVLIADGATWIRNMKEELFPDAQQILDYYHLCENVYDFAKSIFSLNESKYRPWAKDICSALRKSETANVLNEIKPLARKSRDSSTVDLYGYILNNINHIDYAHYEQMGYFIGSGAIESGNKIVLQRRLKQAGMRWNTVTAQNMLTLAAKNASGLWLRDVSFLVHKHHNCLSGLNWFPV
jgi:hypothetical protein